MAAGAFKPFDQGLLAIQNGNIDYLNDTIVAVLLDADYVPDKAANDTYSDISADIITDGDYAPVVIGTKTVTIPAGDEVLYNCANISFGATVTITAKWCVLVKRAAGALAGTDLLLGFADLNTSSGTATASSTGGPFVINTPNGLFGINNVD